MRSAGSVPPGVTLVASDLHLTSADPAGIQRFVRFAAGPAREAARIVLAGDLFDFWVTDAQSRDPGLGPALDAVAALVREGIDVGFIEGNRDFAATATLRALGVRALPDVVVIESGGLRVAVTHGDLLCTADVRYQAFRRLARSQVVRQVLAAAPAALASGAGRAARAGSRVETARKAYGSMGLAPSAVAALIRRTRADALVCGHVHWGRRHAIDVDGRTRDVIVLGAWDEGAPSWARIGGGGVEFVRAADA
ncbi:MAG: UDP-2,3-diacylglucosamine hydrolase [Planctomycetes bacterium]|nr:UDP-2,3-diacylglucosamine hydrolase [Planctomycetota bacterium]